MAARLAPTNVEPAAATSQAAAVWDLLEPVLLSAGYSRIIYTTDHLSGDTRGGVYSYPSLDSYHSRGEMVVMIAASSNIRFCTLYDWNTQSTVPATGTFSASTGTWTGGTWPTTGSPVNNLSITGSSTSAFQFDGTQRYTVRAIASEYGISVIIQGGGESDWVGQERPLCAVRSGREIQVVGQATSDYPLTFGAPSGSISAHIRIRCEGNNFDVTFPTATALSAFRIAQEITRIGKGFVEAYPRNRQAGRDEIVVRIPPERAPAAPYSTTRPQIAITYEDPATQSAGLTFEIASGTWTVITGNPGSIRRVGFVFPLVNIRIGATVRNHTRNHTYTITRFTQTSTVDDTAVLSGDTTTWLSADDIEVYPGPEDHGHGFGSIGGIWQAVLQGSETSNITAGADRVVVLNDRYGEAQGQFQIGQNTLVCNNGRAAVLSLTGVSGTFIRNEEIVSSVGTRAYIRGISGSDLAVDMYQGRTSSAVPWATSHTVTGQLSGATGSITTITAGTTDIGWFQLAPILAIGQANVAAGDYRTTLTLDLDHATFNPGFTVRPCMIVGLRAKILFMVQGPATGHGILPLTVSSAGLGGDVNRHETPLGTEPAHEPDYETHSLMLSEHGFTFGSSSLLTASECINPRTHVRSINARGTVADVNGLLYEDGDSNRKWAIIKLFTSAAIGAGGSPATTWWACHGPTD